MRTCPQSDIQAHQDALQVCYEMLAIDGANPRWYREIGRRQARIEEIRGDGVDTWTRWGIGPTSPARWRNYSFNYSPPPGRFKAAQDAKANGDDWKAIVQAKDRYADEVFTQKLKKAIDSTTFTPPIPRTMFVASTD